MSAPTDDLISQVVEVCNVAPTRAALALGKCRNSVEYAINWIYENPEVEATPALPPPPREVLEAQNTTVPPPCQR